MHCVVDASVALKWLVVEEDSAQANRLLRGDVRLHAPHFLELEIANALWQKVRRKVLDPDAAVALNKKFLQLDIQWRAGKGIGEQALLLGLLSGRSPYDLTYLTLAAHLGCPLVTADRDFVAALEELGLSGMAVPLEDFDPGEVRRVSAE